MALLNQDCKSFVLDCDEIPSSEPPAPVEHGSVRTHKYLVGGLPRTQVSQVSEMFGKGGQPLSTLQIAPICLFNAFEFAQPDVFNQRPFFLVFESKNCCEGRRESKSSRVIRSWLRASSEAMICTTAKLKCTSLVTGNKLHPSSPIWKSKSGQPARTSLKFAKLPLIVSLD